MSNTHGEISVKRVGRFVGKIVAIVGACMVLIVPIAVTRADHIKGTYGNKGFLWMSKVKNYVGLVWVSSPNCNPEQRSAFSRVKNSTTGKPEMPRWNYGIQMSEHRCDGAWDNTIDLNIQYTVGYPSDAWGINIDTLASSAFCQYWNAPYPCGVRPTVFINKGNWDRISFAHKERLIMHETGHSNGLAHHCTTDSIMNDGTNACRGSRWLAVMEYLTTDRTGINRVYPY